MAVHPEKVSIVLPVYNGSRYLRGSIESCLSQTHRNLELIVVDDCSTDTTPDIVRSFGDPRVVYVRNETNQRLPKSLNTGFRRASGDYMTWTSDDNEYQPETIEKMLGFLKEHPGFDFVCADYWSWNEATNEKKQVEIPAPLNLRDRCEVGGCFLYTRQVWKQIGPYNPKYEMVEDYDYWIRISRRFKMGHLPESIYLYRYHSGSLTTRRSHNQEIWDRILRYRNGFIGWQELGWPGVYYFENMKKSDEAETEKKRLIQQTWTRVWKLSPAFSLVFWSAVRYCVLRRFFRRMLGKELFGQGSIS